MESNCSPKSQASPNQGVTNHSESQLLPNVAKQAPVFRVPAFDSAFFGAKDRADLSAFPIYQDLFSIDTLSFTRILLFYPGTTLSLR
jgi:hypothetical protein